MAATTGPSIALNAFDLLFPPNHFLFPSLGLLLGAGPALLLRLRKRALSASARSPPPPSGDRDRVRCCDNTDEILCIVSSRCAEGRSKAGDEAANELRWAMDERLRSVSGETGLPPAAPNAA